jgi:hypothetical protein
LTELLQFTILRFLSVLSVLICTDLDPPVTELLARELARGEDATLVALSPILLQAERGLGKARGAEEPPTISADFLWRKKTIYIINYKLQLKKKKEDKINM